MDDLIDHRRSCARSPSLYSSRASLSLCLYLIFVYLFLRFSCISISLSFPCVCLSKLSPRALPIDDAFCMAVTMFRLPAGKGLWACTLHAHDLIKRPTPINTTRDRERKRQRKKNRHMGSSKSSFKTLATAAVMASLLLLQIAAACDSNEVGECKGEDELIKECLKYVRKGSPDRKPSEGCCSAIQNADIPCLCKLVTPGLANLIDIKKICKVAGECNADLPPPGTKCGSKDFLNLSLSHNLFSNLRLSFTSLSLSLLESLAYLSLSHSLSLSSISSPFYLSFKNLCDT